MLLLVFSYTIFAINLISSFALLTVRLAIAILIVYIYCKIIEIYKIMYKAITLTYLANNLFYRYRG
jgi:hypothetical protein